MAKLHSYFVLCPLLDRKSFLGISCGKSDGEVVVTLGRNVINKYRLSDQKQTGGWTSKDHITAAVVYDQDHDEYVGVFNNNSIKTWKDETENLEKIKKIKFSSHILKLIKLNNTALVIFVNGTCASIQYAIDNRKAGEEKSILKNGDTIKDVATYDNQGTDYICYLLENNKKVLEIVTCPLQPDLGDLVRPKLQKHKAVRDDSDARVIGKVITVAETPTVYVLWSDAKVYSFDLIKFKWKLCGNVPWISTRSNFSMEWMGDKHLILFGSDTEQDGAILVAFNVELGVGSCRYPMKIYCENARIYCINDKLILEAGNDLGVLPYAMETSRSLSSVIGTHEILQDECAEVADWGVGEPPEFDSEDELRQFIEKGLTEQTAAHHLLPPLINEGDFNKLIKATKQFRDIPEDIIVKMLKLAIKQLDDTDEEMDTDYTLHDESKFSHLIKKQTECDFLNHIFTIQFSDAILIPYLRNGLLLKDALFLLTYISHMLDGKLDFDLNYESVIIDWCTLLLDAFYQQYIMTTDQSVTETLARTKNVISKLISYLDKVSDIIPLLDTVITKYKNKNVDNVETSTYSIELMNL